MSEYTNQIVRYQNLASCNTEHIIGLLYSIG